MRVKGLGFRVWESPTPLDQRIALQQETGVAANADRYL